LAAAKISFKADVRFIDRVCGAVEAVARGFV
jgi:hypothetical protein